MDLSLEEIDDILKCINGRIAWTGYLRSQNKSRRSREENLKERLEEIQKKFQWEYHLKFDKEMEAK